MRPPPPLNLESLRSYPVTAGVAALAIAATVAREQGIDCSFLHAGLPAFRGEPWRLLGSALLHGGYLHLFLNLTAFWLLGSIMERVFGSWRTLLLLVFLAGGSAAIADMWGEDGVGLSGVAYGQFALLWVLSATDHRFRGEVDLVTAVFMVVFFFLCIFLTYSAFLNIANVTHAAGAALGALIGVAIGLPRFRALAGGVAVASVLAAFVCGALWRPSLNLFHPGADEAWLGVQTLRAQAERPMVESTPEEPGPPREHTNSEERANQAVVLLQKAVDADDGRAEWWFDLGLAYDWCWRWEDAETAWLRAYELKEDARTKRTLVRCKLFLASQDTFRGRDAEAVQRLREATQLDPDNAKAWYQLGLACRKHGDLSGAHEAFQHAAQLAPDEPNYQNALQGTAGGEEDRKD